MRNFLLAAAFGALALPSAAFAQSTPIRGIELGLSEVAARPLVDAACGTVTRIAVLNTRFPFASNSEVHLRCRNLTLANGRSGGDAVFTFADESLIMIETHGEPSAIAPDTAPATTIAEYEVFMPQQILLNRRTRQAWIVATPALASIALSWVNPAWTDDHPVAPSDPFTMPAQIIFGAALSNIEASLEGVCDLMQIQTIEDIWLDTTPTIQQQLDCYGVEIGGYPRKLEFVFGDGQLEQMWVLFGPSDINRLRAALISRYGEPNHVDENYEAFDGWRIALRKDNPEILMGSERLAEIWRRDGYQ
ncbi:MAG: hypothetical protein KF779_16980 [Hyphomonadaceae bacterium]|nr:hypothetical protein [Hyphomonadaceae bacterium]